MAESHLNEYTPDTVSPPGESLLETLEDLGMSQAELAERTGRPAKTISEIVHGKTAITPETALQFERVLGVPARFWNNRECHYREYLARREEDERLRADLTWLSDVPVRPMARLGWIKEFKDDRTLQAREVLNYFGVASPVQLREIWGVEQVAYRKSPAFQSHLIAVAAWLRKSEIEARKIRCEAFNDERFKECLHRIRRLTVQPPGDFWPEMVRLCASSGVAVTVVPELPGTRLCGAAHWFQPSRAFIHLSLRHKANDVFWFTFFHEAGHLLLHGKRRAFLDSQDDSKDDFRGDEESEADQFAANLLIPAADYQRLRARGRPTEALVTEFARDLGIAPGIIVGRLQHEGVLPWRDLNRLKQQFRWTERGQEDDTTNRTAASRG